MLKLWMDVCTNATVFSAVRFTRESQTSSIKLMKLQCESGFHSHFLNSFYFTNAAVRDLFEKHTRYEAGFSLPDNHEAPSVFLSET